MNLLNRNRVAKSVFILLLFSVVSFSGCRRAGCMSTDGINFDVEAKVDDGTCIYPSDVFAGVYSYNDTILRRYNTFPDSTQTFYRNDTFILYVLEPKLVSWKSYSSCSDTIRCDLTSTNLSIQTGYNCNGLWDNFLMTRTNQTLRYSYRIGFGGIVTDEIRGTAIMKPR